MPDANQTPGSRSHRSLALPAPHFHPVATSTPRCAASQIMHAACEDDSQTPLHRNQPSPIVHLGSTMHQRGRAHAYTSSGVCCIVLTSGYTVEVRKLLHLSYIRPPCLLRHPAFQPPSGIGSPLPRSRASGPRRTSPTLDRALRSIRPSTGSLRPGACGG